MLTREQAEEMIERYIKEIGLQKEQTYNPDRKAYYWMKGSARIEVFIEEIKFATHSRFYLRVFSPVYKVPVGRELQFYKRLLEMNDGRLGVKLTVMPNSDQVYATMERDIAGMDYEELSTTIADLEWWADEIDDELAREFSGGTPR